MLKVRKLLYDENGNISMSFNHYKYKITVTSKPDDYIFNLLVNYGIFVDSLYGLNGYSRKKEFMGRCYNLKKLGIYHECKWFVRSKHLAPSVIADVLSHKIYGYQILVNVSLFGIGLSNTDSLDAGWYDYITNRHTKKELLEYVNDVIQEAWGNANDVERNLFPRVHGVANYGL